MVKYVQPIQKNQQFYIQVFTKLQEMIRKKKSFVESLLALAPRQRTGA
jgi:predicted CopG family antitoxin